MFLIDINDEEPGEVSRRAGLWICSHYAGSLLVHASQEQEVRASEPAKHRELSETVS